MSILVSLSSVSNRTLRGLSDIRLLKVSESLRNVLSEGKQFPFSGSWLRDLAANLKLPLDLRFEHLFSIDASMPLEITRHKSDSIVSVEKQERYRASLRSNCSQVNGVISLLALRTTVYKGFNRIPTKLDHPFWWIIDKSKCYSSRFTRAINFQFAPGIFIMQRVRQIFFFFITLYTPTCKTSSSHSLFSARREADARRVESALKNVIAQDFSYEGRVSSRRISALTIRGISACGYVAWRTNRTKRRRCSIWSYFRFQRNRRSRKSGEEERTAICQLASSSIQLHPPKCHVSRNK